MIVRLANSDDIRLIQSAALLERSVELSPESASRLLENPQNRVALAIEDGRVAGYVIAYLLDRLDGRRMALIYDVFVDENLRRQGIGSRLMSLMLEEVRSAGVSKAWLFTGNDNIAAQRLYDSLGAVGDGGQRLYWFKGA